MFKTIDKDDDNRLDAVELLVMVSAAMETEIGADLNLAKQVLEGARDEFGESSIISGLILNYVCITHASKWQGQFLAFLIGFFVLGKLFLVVKTYLCYNSLFEGFIDFIGFISYLPFFAKLIKAIMEHPLSIADIEQARERVKQKELTFQPKAQPKGPKSWEVY